MAILTVEFKDRVEGLDEVTCKGISADPMNDDYFIITFDKNDIWIVPMRNIKHIR